jgi:signal transduction histidine kinase
MALEVNNNAHGFGESGGGSRRIRAMALCAADSALDQAALSLPAEERPERERSLYRAVAEFARAPADVVLVDLDWLEAGKLDVIRVLRELNPTARIIVVFSISAREKAVEALTRGADTYLIQPFYPAEFRAVWSSARMNIGRAPGGAQKDALESLQKLVFGFGHEVRNILASLSGNLQMLATDTKLPEADRKLLQERVDECDRITQLMSRFEDMAQIRKGAFARVSLDTVLSEVVNGAQSRTMGNGIRMEADLSADGAVVLGDENQLRRALADLLGDAEEALDGRGNLRVSSRKGADYVEVTIGDTGRPLPAEVRDRLSEPYAVLTRAHSNNLSIIYAACSGVFQSHGGSLRAGIGQDRINQFVIRLPLA